MDQVKWDVKSYSEAKDSPWKDEHTESIVDGVLVINDSVSGELHALEPPPDLAPQGIYTETRKHEQADRLKVMNENVTGYRTVDDVAARTAGRPASIGVGAGTMRRDFTDDPLVSSVALKPKD